MKIIVLFILSFCSSAYAQNITFKEIRLKPKSKFYNVNETTIIYPIVVTNNKKIDKLINDKIKKEILDEDNEQISVRKALNEQISDGLINMSYEITFKKYNILSMNIYGEGCAAYCSSGNTYFNFDLKTGRTLEITDLISDNKIDSFRKIVFNDKVKALNVYKIEEIDNLNQKYIDSITCNWALEQVDSNCIKTAQIENFSLSNLNIEIIDPCEFLHAIRSQEPAYQLKYSYKWLSPFLKQKFQRQLLK
jgi:hypothetical protein